ncbi:Hypothetical predicted protein, partial [Pelobates cultripes]
RRHRKMVLKLFSLNVRGLNMPHRRQMLFKEAKKQRSVVLLIEETHFKKNCMPHRMLTVYPTPYHSIFTKKSRGVRLVVNSLSMFEHHETLNDPFGRYLLLQCIINNAQYMLVNIYGPHEGHHIFQDHILTLTNAHKFGEILIGGDTNFILDPTSDITSSSKISHKTTKQRAHSTALIENVLHIHGCLDIWRALHPLDKDYTYHSLVHDRYSRIDCFLLPSAQTSKISSANIGIITWSDHAPITLSLTTQYPTSGNRTWRLNDSLLTDHKLHV